jgi:two-component system sensor histidine kinase KdpD
MRRSVIGPVAALASMALLTVAMLPLRSHLSIATTALVLVVPVVIGVVFGGFTAGVLSVIAGFLVYDFFFIPPYLTLWVGAPQNWVALGVYAVVMLPVAKVVATMNTTRTKERQQSLEIRRLFQLSDLLVEDQPLDVLLTVIVSTLADVFGSSQVALLLPQNGRLEVAASTGTPLIEEQLHRVVPEHGAPASLDAQSIEHGDLLVLALTAAGRPVGLLVMSGEGASNQDREPLLLFANHAALAVERAQLREEALQAKLTEAVARLAKTLVAAVSHDLRAPLASIKAASSTLSDAELDIAPEKHQRLAKLIDLQADRLADLVQNLLDMSRIQSGVLTPRCTIISLANLVQDVVSDVSATLRNHDVVMDVPADLPPVDVDLVLIARVLTNLVENAARYAPKRTPIMIGAEPDSQETIKVSVTDHGPGIDPGQRDEVFGLPARRDRDAGAGLGLTIARTFVEAHGQHIWVEDAPDGGARFCFTLPIALAIREESRFVADSHR